MSSKRSVDNSSLLEAFFNNFHTAIAIMDKNFNFIRVNELYAKADNRSVTEFLGHNHFEFYPSDKARLIFENVLRTKKIFQVHDYPFVYPNNPDQGITYWDWTLSPVLDENGDVEILILYLVNVNRRKAAEAKLRESEEKFHCFFDSSLDGMLIATQDGTIVVANPAICQMVGMTEEEICSGGRDALVDGSDLRLYQLLMDRSQTGQCKGELNFIHKDGCKIPVEITSQVYKISSGKKFTATIVKNISKRIKLQQEMARLERLNVTGQMAAGIGHEVRNPLTVVRGFLQLLSGKEKYSAEKGYFEVMISELDRANSIISDFLSMSRCAPSGLALENLNEIIKDLYPLIQAGGYGSDKDIIFTPMPIPDIYLNKKEIQQLLLNLVRNGIEAIPKRGKVEIKTLIDGGEVVLAIEDDGTGIDQEILDKLGTPFFTTKADGTGMGLATCYRIAEKNNARIDVETSSGGTTFFVRFKPH